MSFSQIYEFTKRDFFSNFKDSSIGFFWALIRPLFVMIIMYYAIAGGLRHENSNSSEYKTYFFLGYITWQSFALALSGSVSILKRYSFALREPGFNFYVLYIGKALSDFLFHLMGLFSVVIIMIVLNLDFYLNFFDFLLYGFFFIFLNIILGPPLSLICAISNDFAKFVQLYVSIGMWFTPVFWKIEAFATSKFLPLIQLNPSFILVDLVRTAFGIGSNVYSLFLMSILYGFTLLFVIIVHVFIVKRLRYKVLEVL